MMFGLSKRERAAREVADIQTWIIGQSLGTAASFEAKAQMVVAIEALCFFLHALSRLSYRRDSENLRMHVFDSSVRTLVHTFAGLLRQYSVDLNTPHLEADILALISTRELEYAEASTLLSDKFNDRNSALWRAGFFVAEAAGIPDRDIRIQVIVTELVRSLTDMDLARRIQRVEAFL